MVRRYKIGIALLACGLVVGVAWFVEKKSRPWRVPAYHVSIPVEFDAEDVEGRWKQGEVYQFSSRKQYLHFHKRGWEIAKNEWVHGRSNRNYLVQAAIPANEAMRDGRQQFLQERM